MNRVKFARQIIAGLSAAIADDEEHGDGFKWSPAILAVEILGASGLLMLLASVYKKITREQAEIEDRLGPLERLTEIMSRKIDKGQRDNADAHAAAGVAEGVRAGKLAALAEQLKELKCRASLRSAGSPNPGELLGDYKKRSPQAADLLSSIPDDYVWPSDGSIGWERKIGAGGGFTSPAAPGAPTVMDQIGAEATERDAKLRAGAAMRRWLDRTLGDPLPGPNQAQAARALVDRLAIAADDGTELREVAAGAIFALSLGPEECDDPEDKETIEAYRGRAPFGWALDMNRTPAPHGWTCESGAVLRWSTKVGGWYPSKGDPSEELPWAAKP